MANGDQISHDAIRARVKKHESRARQYRRWRRTLDTISLVASGIASILVLLKVSENDLAVGVLAGFPAIIATFVKGFKLSGKAKFQEETSFKFRLFDIERDKLTDEAALKRLIELDKEYSGGRIV